MNLGIIIYGLLFVAVGFLLKAYPNIIVGYKMSPTETVDMKKVSVCFRNSFIIEGLIVILGYLSLMRFDMGMMAELMIMVPLIGLMIIIPFAQNYDKNRIKQNFTPIAAITMALFLAVVFIPGLLPAKMTVSDQKVCVSGMYSADINVSDIEKVQLVKYLPRITMKTNGFALGRFCKGYFDLNRWGNCKLFLTADYGPFLVITDKEGFKTIINNKDTTVTINDYSQIKKQIKKEEK